MVVVKWVDIKICRMCDVMNIIRVGIYGLFCVCVYVKIEIIVCNNICITQGLVCMMCFMFDIECVVRARAFGN